MSSIALVSIVIPVYNEEGSLPTLLEELGAVAVSCSNIVWEYIFVDDGSQDASLAILEVAASHDLRIKVVSFSRNFGQTAALSCGIRLASGEVIVPLDADLQNDPADIPRFLARLEEGYDCVSGWRKVRQDGFWLRRLPSWLANKLISWATGVSLHDYGCSLKAYKRSYIQDVGLYGEMHRFIPAYIAWVGGRVDEIVTYHRARRYGVSKYGLSRVPKVMLDLLVVKFLTKYFNKPMHFFGGVGALSLLCGLITGTWAVILKLTQHTSFIATPLPLVSILFAIVAVQLVMSGLLAEVLMRTYYESDQTRPYTVRVTINIRQPL